MPPISPAYAKDFLLHLEGRWGLLRVPNKMTLEELAMLRVQIASALSVIEETTDFSEPEKPTNGSVDTLTAEEHKPWPPPGRRNVTGTNTESGSVEE